jgi:hypothetical protein
MAKGFASKNGLELRINYFLGPKRPGWHPIYILSAMSVRMHPERSTRAFKGFTQESSTSTLFRP